MHNDPALKFRKTESQKGCSPIHLLQWPKFGHRRQTPVEEDGGGPRPRDRGGRDEVVGCVLERAVPDQICPGAGEIPLPPRTTTHPSQFKIANKGKLK